MSWETLLVGTIELNKCSKKEVDKLVEFAKHCLELKQEDIKYEFLFNPIKIIIDIVSINWTSHVCESSLNLFTKYALKLPFVNSISLSLYYLNESDYSVYVERVKEYMKDFYSKIKGGIDISEEKDTIEYFVKLFPELTAEILSENIINK